jgi:hypothetical protein
MRLSIISRTSTKVKKESHRQFLDRLGDTLRFRSFEDWYNLKPQDLEGNGGKHLLSIYGSISSVIQSTYPEYPWFQNDGRLV